MNFISKILSSVLVLLISGITVAFIMSATLFNANYYKQKATELHLYDQLAVSIPDSLGHEDPSTKAALQNIVSSQYVQNKLNPFLDQLQQYYFNNGPEPQIDFTDVVAEAQRQGIDVPANNQLNKPIAFHDTTGIKQQLGWINIMKTWGLLAALLLAAGIVALNKGFHRFTALGRTLIVAGIWEGLLFLLMKVLPGLFESLIKSNNQIGPMGPVIIGFFKAVGADISQGFGVAAAGLAAAGVILIVVGLIVRGAGMFGHGDKGGSSSRWVRPNANDRPSIH